MIAKVIPAVKMPRGRGDSFDYLVEDGLEVGRGSLVFVPWRGRQLLGVVQEMTDESGVPESKLKPIAGLAQSTPLAEDWLATLEWAADRYFTPLSTLVRCFLPTAPKRLKPLIQPIDKEHPSTDIAQQLHLAGQADGHVRLYASAEEKWQATEEAVVQCLKKGRSVIVLAPHHQDIVSAQARLERYCPKDHLVAIHGKLAAGKLWKAWAAALAGEAVVVVGSRLASMAPLPRLGLVIVTEADSPDHKQYDQNPRYDARALARIRAEKAAAGVMVMTAAPRAEEVMVVAQGYRLEQAFREPAPAVLADISAWGKEWSGPLAPASLERISESLQKGKNALIYHNRHGLAGALACADCQQVFRCTTCDLALSVRSGKLKCGRCGLEKDSPADCEHCGSLRLRPIGWGTTTVEAYLRKQLPEANILLVDPDTERRPAISAGSILIGSRQLVHDLIELEDASFGTVIVTSAEDLLRRPGFRAIEDAWGLVRRLRYLASSDHGELVLQALDTEDLKIRSLIREPKPFLYDELAARKQAGYPPIGRLVLVTARGKTERQARTAAKTAHSRLQAACKHNGSGTLLSQPFRPSNPVSHGTWRQTVAIKAPLIGSELTVALRALPDEYIIEPDPETPA